MGQVDGEVVLRESPHHPVLVDLALGYHLEPLSDEPPRKGLALSCIECLEQAHPLLLDALRHLVREQAGPRASPLREGKDVEVVDREPLQELIGLSKGLFVLTREADHYVHSYAYVFHPIQEPGDDVGDQLTRVPPAHALEHRVGAALDRDVDAPGDLCRGGDDANQLIIDIPGVDRAEPDAGRGIDGLETGKKGFEVLACRGVAVGRQVYTCKDDLLDPPFLSEPP